LTSKLEYTYSSGALFIFYTRAIRKVTIGELISKQAIRKKYCIKKNMYILKLLPNVITGRIEAPVISGNKFLYACVKEVCNL
jgi:hypothetical protein